jgi:hypothetical protein
MTSQGGAYSRFRRALDTGNLLLIRTAAAELPQAPNLDDALKICLLLREGDPGKYDRAVVRWLGRFCLERPFASFYDLQRAISAFDRLQEEPEQSERVLRKLVNHST